MRKVIKIDVHNQLTELDLDAPEGSYKVLSNGVGGLIEAVDITENLTMWVNEEGKFAEFPLINAVGNAYFQRAFGAVDVIVGDVVFSGGVDDEGDTLGLTEAQVKALTFMVS